MKFKVYVEIEDGNLHDVMTINTNNSDHPGPVISNILSNHFMECDDCMEYFSPEFEPYEVSGIPNLYCQECYEIIKKRMEKEQQNENSL